MPIRAGAPQGNPRVAEGAPNLNAHPNDEGPGEADQIDVELHVAVDELLGIRYGPDM